MPLTKHGASRTINKAEQFEAAIAEAIQALIDAGDISAHALM